jgi:hypothetical protein
VPDVSLIFLILRKSVNHGSIIMCWRQELTHIFCLKYNTANLQTSSLLVCVLDLWRLPCFSYCSIGWSPWILLFSMLLCFMECSLDGTESWIFGTIPSLEQWKARMQLPVSRCGLAAFPVVWVYSSLCVPSYSRRWACTLPWYRSQMIIFR